MASTIVVCGYGPGISAAVANKFGSHGFQVALVARSRDKLEKGVEELRARGVHAQAFPCDLGDLDAVKQLFIQISAELGPVTVLHWNAYAGLAGDLTTCDPAELRTVFDVGVTGSVAAVQAALPDLRDQPNAAILITGGGFAYYDTQVDSRIVRWNAMGLGVAKAAQHKLTHLLHHKLKSQGIYVGSVMVLSLVKGTAFDTSGGQGLEPSAVADRFWQLYEARSPVTVTIPS